MMFDCKFIIAKYNQHNNNTFNSSIVPKMVIAGVHEYLSDCDFIRNW